jgi:hypothetical protein
MGFSSTLDGAPSSCSTCPSVMPLLSFRQLTLFGATLTGALRAPTCASSTATRCSRVRTVSSSLCILESSLDCANPWPEAVMKISAAQRQREPFRRLSPTFQTGGAYCHRCLTCDWVYQPRDINNAFRSLQRRDDRYGLGSSCYGSGAVQSQMAVTDPRRRQRCHTAWRQGTCGSPSTCPGISSIKVKHVVTS